MSDLVLIAVLAFSLFVPRTLKKYWREFYCYKARSIFFHLKAMYSNSLWPHISIAIAQKTSLPLSCAWKNDSKLQTMFSNSFASFLTRFSFVFFRLDLFMPLDYFDISLVVVIFHDYLFLNCHAQERVNNVHCGRGFLPDAFLSVLLDTAHIPMLPYLP